MLLAGDASVDSWFREIHVPRAWPVYFDLGIIHLLYNFFSDCCTKLISYHCSFQSDVYICMELMTTCLDKLMKKLQGPIPEDVLGKISVSVSTPYLQDTSLGSLCME